MVVYLFADFKMVLKSCSVLNYQSRVCSLKKTPAKIFFLQKYFRGRFVKSKLFEGYA